MSRTLTRYIDQYRLRVILLLGSMSLFCLALCLVRVAKTDSPLFLFLNWNLFLAAVPFAITTALVNIPRLRENKIGLGILMTTWLLFFPNAPYILTDIFHLRYSTAAPQWFDLILVLSYAWTGLLFGLLSLLDVERLMKKHIPTWLVNTMIAGLLFLSSFGIYLGRFLRLNSWEIVSAPIDLFRSILDAVSQPTDPSPWGLTLLLGTLLLFMFWSIKMIAPQESR